MLHWHEKHGRQDALMAMMFICLFNPTRLYVSRAGDVIQLSPVAASLCFLSADGVVVWFCFISSVIGGTAEYVIVLPTLWHIP
jgi:hypothetical protein